MAGFQPLPAPAEPGKATGRAARRKVESGVVSWKKAGQLSFAGNMP
jgi:hypothetical protein